MVAVTGFPFLLVEPVTDHSGERRHKRTTHHSGDQVGDKVLDQGCGSVPRVGMAEMPEGGTEDACQEAQDSGQGNTPRLADAGVLRRLVFILTD
jgi:hypothetical protein